MRKPWRLAALALSMGLMLLTAACGRESGPKALTQRQLKEATEALDGLREENGVCRLDGRGCLYNQPILSYDRPEDIDLERFLLYFPTKEHVRDEDAEEFAAVVALSAWDSARWNEAENRPLRPSDLPVPTNRIPEEDVNAVLSKWTGITWEEIGNQEGVLYLEEYHAFYTTTSDATGNNFVCSRGEIEGDTVRLWSEDYYEHPRLLTLRQKEGKWYIQSFQWLEDGDLTD